MGPADLTLSSKQHLHGVLTLGHTEMKVAPIEIRVQQTWHSFFRFILAVNKQVDLICFGGRICSKAGTHETPLKQQKFGGRLVKLSWKQGHFHTAVLFMKGIRKNPEDLLIGC